MPMRIGKRLNAILFTYRYDIASLTILFLVITAILSPILTPGHIVFSDLDFPGNSTRYLEQMSGIWNDRWNTSTQLNIPRFIFTLIPWGISAVAGFSGAVFLKAYIVFLSWTSALSLYLFLKRLTSVYHGKEFSLGSLLAVGGASLFYAVNPWFLTRIQHLYLLCGYALLPLTLMFFFNIFDPRFQEQLIPRYRLFRSRLYGRNIIDIALASFTISIMSAAIHYFFYTIILYGMLWVLLLVKLILTHRRAPAIAHRTLVGSFLQKGVLIGVFTLLFSANWLLIYLAGVLSSTAASQHNINVSDTLMLFSRYSQLPWTAYLVSYWWPMFDIGELGWSFHLASVWILILVAFGIFKTALKYHIFTFFTILTLLFLIFASGTAYPGIDIAFEILVRRVPVIGSMFRDPNKLIGLATLGYSLFLGFAFHEFHRSRRTRHPVIVLSLIAVSIIAYSVYLGPYIDVYLNGFLKPVLIPPEYDEINTTLVETAGEESRVLVFPVADNMTQSGSGVATYRWNRSPDPDILEKAAGDYTIYQLPVNAIFHHEGNLPSIGYRFAFIQRMIDEGRTLNLERYIWPLGTDMLLYQDTFQGQEARQDFNQSILSLQDGLAELDANDIFTLYTVAAAAENEEVPLVLNSEGIDSTSLLADTPGLGDFQRNIYLQLATESLPSNSLPQNSMVFTKNPQDLWLSILPREYYLQAALSVDTGNPIIGWSQTAVHTPDWAWQTRSQGLQEVPAQFDFLSNLAVTYASAGLSGPNYRWATYQGRIIMDFETMLRLAYFFVPDNPESFEILASPSGRDNPYPQIRGSIQRSDNQELWQVAKSGLIPVSPDTPYRFRIGISGRGTNELHVKFRYFDEDKQELGMSYAVSPGEYTNYDGINFLSEYVSPRGSAYVRMDLLSRQRPEQKVYWWIHDVELEELSEFAIPNTFHFTSGRPAGRYRVYARHFLSKNGGDYEISSSDSTLVVNTQRSGQNAFAWEDIGEMELTNANEAMEIRNLSGFQAINLFAFIPFDRIEDLQQPARELFYRNDLIIGLEAEKDFTFPGELQSTRIFPELSNGRGIRSSSSSLSRNLHIPASGMYRITLNGSQSSEETGFLLGLYQNGHQFIEPIEVNLRQEQETPEHSASVVDLFEPLDTRIYSRVLREVSGELASRQQFISEELALPEGNYTLRLDFIPRSESMIGGIRKFTPGNVKTPAFIEGEDLLGCSACELIEPEDLQISQSRNPENGNIDFTATMKETCSCEWYIVSTQTMPAMPLAEYYIGYDARSDFLGKRHAKIFFLDEDRQMIATHFISEVEEPRKGEWNSYEHISMAPLHTSYIMVQWWGRGERENPGLLEVRDLRLHALRDLNLVDSLLITGSTEGQTIGQSVVADSGMAPAPIWQSPDGEPVILDGATQGFLYASGTPADTDAPRERLFWYGLAGLPAGALLMLFLYKITRHPVPLLRRLHSYGVILAKRLTSR